MLAVVANYTIVKLDVVCNLYNAVKLSIKVQVPTASKGKMYWEKCEGKEEPNFAQLLLAASRNRYRSTNTSEHINYCCSMHSNYQ